MLRRGINHQRLLEYVDEKIHIEFLISSVFKEKLEQCKNQGLECVRETDFREIYVKDYGYFCPFNITLTLFRKNSFRKNKIFHLFKQDNTYLYNLLTSTQDEINFIMQYIYQINSKYSIAYPDHWIDSLLPKLIVKQLYQSFKVKDPKQVSLLNKDLENLNKFKTILQVNFIKSLLI